MADNYLENKMEEHRARRGSSVAYRPLQTPRGSRPGEWVVKFTPCDVVIAGFDEPAATLHPEVVAIIQHLVGIGFKVLFRYHELHQGQKLASTLGARLLPSGMKTPDGAIHINITANGIAVRRNDAEILIPDNSDYSQQTAVWTAVYLANH